MKVERLPVLLALLGATTLTAGADMWEGGMQPISSGRATPTSPPKDVTVPADDSGKLVSPPISGAGSRSHDVSMSGRRTQQAMTLETSSGWLLPAGWTLMFADNRFREVVLRFKGNDHNLVRWSEIYDDAGKRFGIAFLADTRLKSIIATPADEFRYPGVHYVQSTVAEHAARFQWQYWLGQSTIAAGEHDLALKRGEQQALLAQQARNAAVVAEHKAELYAKYRSEYERLQAEHAARSEELDASFRLNKQRQMELELAISVNETSSAQQRRNSEDLVAQRERVIVQGELLEQQKLELEREHRETLEAALADTRNQQAELALAREQLAQQIVRYYPDFDRKMQASGVDVETAVRGYLDEQWNYNLAFDNSLLAANQRGALRFEYDLYFSGSKLEVDVSKIACAITRDHDGILAMAQIQPDTRLVYMQLHRASQENRSKAIAQCY